MKDELNIKQGSMELCRDNISLMNREIKAIKPHRPKNLAELFKKKKALHRLLNKPVLSTHVLKIDYHDSCKSKIEY